MWCFVVCDYARGSSQGSPVFLRVYQVANITYWTLPNDWFEEHGQYR